MTPRAGRRRQRPGLAGRGTAAGSIAASTPGPACLAERFAEPVDRRPGTSRGPDRLARAIPLGLAGPLPRDELAAGPVGGRAPPLMLGAGRAGLMAAVTSWIAHRISGRIRRVRAPGRPDRRGRLPRARPRADRQRRGPGPRAVDQPHVRPAARDAGRRSASRSGRGLLAQLAAGLAHQLRNSLTGARMSVQLHAKRCAGRGGDRSLDVALRQLRMTEEQVKGLLSLGRVEERPAAPCDLGRLVGDVAVLVDPACQHARVDLAVGPRTMSRSTCWPTSRACAPRS